MVSLSCVIDRCAGGECDVEEENLRGNSVRLHQTRLGSSTVILHSVCVFSCLSLPLCVSAGNFKGTPNKTYYNIFDSILKNVQTPPQLTAETRDEKSYEKQRAGMFGWIH